MAKLLCKFTEEEGWGRHVFRLQDHVVATNLTVKRGKRNWKGKTKVCVLSKCRPMMELFKCDNLMKQERDWWSFELEMGRLKQKMSCPIGSCKLALPLGDQGMACWIFV